MLHLRLKGILASIIFFVIVLSGCAVNQPIDEKKAGSAPESSIQSTKKAAHTMYQEGRYYQEKGNYAEAINAYERVLELDPDSAKAHNGLGVIYSYQGEHRRAIQSFKEAMKLLPGSSSLYNNLGYSYLQYGNEAKAIDAFHRAIELDPGNKHARKNLAVTYKKIGCTQNQPCAR